MARPEGYDPKQWQTMNEPGKQQRIRADLNNYMRSYLDSAPEGRELSRAKEVLLMLKRYFEHESRLAAESHDESSRFLKAELVVSFLDGMDFIRMDDEVEAAHERNLDEWEEFKRRKLGEGKD